MPNRQRSTLPAIPTVRGGLDQVATVIAELGEDIDAALLVKAAETAPMPWAQRLGYLMELAETGAKAEPLRRFVATHARDYAPLSPGIEKPAAQRHKGWKLVINTDVEPEL